MASSELHLFRRSHFVVLLLLFMLTLSSVVHPLIVPLTHRDSPNSPFYDPKATLVDRWRSTYRRSLAPRRYEIGGEYHMRIKIGRVVLTGWIDVAGRLVSTPCWDNGHGTVHYNYSDDNRVSCDSIYCSMMDSLCTGRNSTGGKTCEFYVVKNASVTLSVLMHDISEIPNNGSAVPASTDLSFACLQLDLMASTTVGIMGSALGVLQQLTHDGRHIKVTRFSHCDDPHL